MTDAVTEPTPQENHDALIAAGLRHGPRDLGKYELGDDFDFAGVQDVTFRSRRRISTRWAERHDAEGKN
jgi:hypothetical protein